MSEQFAYTVAEACKIAAISRTELYRCVQRGEIVLRKRGRRSLILAEELKRWLSELPTGPAQPL
jgi:excisionase family DNA binding protein